MPIFTCDSADSYGTWNADHAYETLYSNGVYNKRFVYFLDECLDSYSIFNCVGCSNCFACVNLGNQSYRIWNRKYTKGDHKREIEKLNLGGHQVLLEVKKKWDFCRKMPRRFAFITNSINVSGDDIKNEKNCWVCFSALNGVENRKYLHLAGHLLKDSYDISCYGGDMSELSYEVNELIKSRRDLFSRACHDSQEVEYSYKVYNSSYIFGYTEIRNKRYCVLNKQYTEDEYQKLVPKIREHMMGMPYADQRGFAYHYGEFFPSEMSLWTYSETVAQKYFSPDREQALAGCFGWFAREDRHYEPTTKISNLLDDIRDVPDSVLREVIECGHKDMECRQERAGAFHILPEKLVLIWSMKVPLPRLCSNCRYGEHNKIKNSPKLWRRSCMYGGTASQEGVYQNTVGYFHGGRRLSRLV